MIMSHYFFDLTHFRGKGRNKEILYPKVTLKLTDLYVGVDLKANVCYPVCPTGD